MNKESIVLKSFELLKFTIPTINKIPRNQKFTFGDRLQNLLSDLMEDLIDVYYAPRSEQYLRLKEINTRLVKIRYYFRLGHELGFYSVGYLGVLSEKINEIGRMVGGWMKSLTSQKIS